MANTKITTAVIKDDAITTAKIADDAVTGALIADDVALAGNPTTTTQSAGNSTTRIATTAFVTTAVSNLVDSAPGALDTLNELAAALGDDASFSTTVTNSIATKLPLAGGTLTGDLVITGTTPTLTIGDAGAEDTAIVFDGNAQDFYIGLDDSADHLIIGKGSTVGTTPIISVDGNERVLIGTTASRTMSGVTPNFFLEGTSYADSSIGAVINANGQIDCPAMFFGKSRGTSLGSNTVVQNGDRLFSMRIDGSDGTNLEQAAIIEVYVDGTVANNSIPGQFRFMTTTVGDQYATEKMRIDNAGTSTFTPSGGTFSVEANAFVYAKQTLDTVTAGARFYGMSNRGVLGHLAIEQAATGVNGGYITLNTCASGSTTPTERIRIRSDGNVGIGAVGMPSYSGYTQLSVGAMGHILAHTASTTNGALFLSQNAHFDADGSWETMETDEATLYYQNAGDHIFQRAASTSAGTDITWLDSMRLTANGTFLHLKSTDDVDTIGNIFGTGGQVYSSTTSSNNTYHYRDTTNTRYNFYVGGNGQVNARISSIALISDGRLKENVRDYTVGLNDILKLKPRVFDWIPTEGEKNQVGFIAQEFEEVFPDWVGSWLHDELEDAKSVSASEIIYPMVNAIKELSTEIESLKAEIKVLKEA